MKATALLPDEATSQSQLLNFDDVAIAIYIDAKVLVAISASANA